VRGYCTQRDTNFMEQKSTPIRLQIGLGSTL